ncbi:MAG: hypothetical protein LBK60_10285 [Verrucomicrobiales bacterium]|jgi:hypothetical protein|nr:hypothetical protein [Verrucomicrobiales bacterium]
MRKIKRDKDGYEYDSDDFRSEDLTNARLLTRGEMAKLGLPLTSVPTGDELVDRIKLERLNIQLSKDSVDYFKDTAKRRKVPYQPLIRAAMDFYVDKARMGALPAA